MDSLNSFLGDIGSLNSFLGRDDRTTIPKSLPVSDREFLATPKAVRLALKLVEAYAVRKRDALLLYRPLPAAVDFHSCNKRIRLISGSNQAGKATEINTPVLTPDGFVAIGDLKVEDQVIGGDGKPCNVIGVYPQGEKDVFKLTFDEGTSITCCDEHLWKVAIGHNRFGDNRNGNEKWEVLNLASIRKRCGDDPRADMRPATQVCVAEMNHQEVPIHPYLLGSILGDGCIGKKGSTSFSTGDKETVGAMSGMLPDGLQLNYAGQYDYRISRKGAGGRKNEVTEAMRSLGLAGHRSWEKFVPKIYLNNSAEVRLAVLRGLMDTDGSISDRRSEGHGGTVEYCTTSPQLAKDVEFLVRSLGGKCKTKWRVTSYTYKGVKKNGRPSARLRIRMTINPFLLKRKADRFIPAESTCSHRLIYKIEPAGRAECVCIAVDSPDRTYVTSDFIVTHNTLTAEAEFAYIGRGMDPYRKRPDRDQKMLAVGKDFAHVGQVMWRKLHWTGAFEIIIDEDTGLWRSVRPDPKNPTQIDPRDLARKSEWMPAPPLIPPAAIAEMAWESKGEGIPSIVKLKNGTEMMFRTSNGKPPNGVQLDFIHFDEEITNSDWYPEMVPRLVRKGGLFIWSATPQSQTPQFFGLHRDCLAGDPDVAEFTLLIQDNPYMLPDDKEAMRRRLLSYGEDEYAVRWLGKYAIQGREVYPTYDLSVQGYDQEVVPDDWMTVAVIDPGSQVSAFALFAVDPESRALHVIGECELRNKDASHLASALKSMLAGRTPEAYIIDKRGGIQIPMGRSNSTAEHYYAEFRRQRLPDARINPGGFVYGCDIPAAREQSVKRLLNDGKLRFRRGHCFKMDQQIKNRFYDKNDPDKRERRTTHDLVDILEYAAAFFDETGLYYHKPKQNVLVLSSYDQKVYDSFKKKKKRGWKLS